MSLHESFQDIYFPSLLTHLPFTSQWQARMDCALGLH